MIDCCLPAYADVYNAYSVVNCVYASFDFCWRGNNWFLTRPTSSHWNLNFFVVYAHDISKPLVTGVH